MVPHPLIDVCWYIWTICSYLSLTISSLSLLSLKSFPSSLVNLSSSICNFRWSLVSHFSTTDETAADEALSSFCLFLAGRKSCPFIFPKMFTNLSADPCHKYSPPNLPSSVVLPKHRTLQEFWHIYQLILYLCVWVFSLSKMRFYIIKLELVQG